MDVAYTPMFLRMLKALPKELQEETIEKIELFQDLKMHDNLKVHKLKGRLAGRYSFSIDYRTRAVFQFEKVKTKKTAILLAIGDHEVYR
jgi:mRNA-degrading endonuclease YafQ of YafQ-DinJ toxin-antitoxin module